MTRVRTVLLPPALAIVFAALLCAVALLINGDSTHFASPRVTP